MYINKRKLKKYLILVSILLSTNLITYCIVEHVEYVIVCDANSCDHVINISFEYETTQPLIKGVK